MKFRWGFAAPVVVLLALLPAAAHEDLLGTHYVAMNGVDSGDCRHATMPCLTIAYAQSQSLPGDLIKIAEGTYAPIDRELAALFYSPIKIVGGYSVSDAFATQSAQQHATTLIASQQWESAARARGFRFIASDNDSVDSQLGLSVQGAAPPANCVQGSAGVFPCRNVDLLAHLPLAAFSSQPTSAADLWGFIDRNTQREYVVIGLSNGTAVVDITDPSAAHEVAFVPGLSSLWREPTVYQTFDANANRYRAYAYVSTEARGGSVEVIDLSALPASATHVGQLNDMLSAHTVYVSNVEYAGSTPRSALPAFLVVAGSNANGGALRMYDLSNPSAPQLVTNPAAGYMHDSTSLIVTDARTPQCAPGHNPCEVLADFNVETVDLWDVSNKSAPVRLSSTTYPTARYVHSGWPTDDGKFLFVFDELDELRIAGFATHIYTLDLSSLTAPVIRTSYIGPTTATDHNGYVKGDRLYVSHYRRGLVVFDITDPNNLKEVGNFDSFINPSADVAGTDGNWGAYPFFPSGTLAISDIDNGLFILRDHTRDLQNRVGRIGFGTSAIAATESQAEIAIAVRRVDGRQGALSIQYATSDGTATAGADFQAVSGTLTWSDGDDADKLIRVPLINNSAVEDAETFSVALSNLSSNSSIDGSSTLTVTIVDDDAPSAPAMPSSSSSRSGGCYSLALIAMLLSLLLYRHRATATNRAAAQARYSVGNFIPS